MPDVTTVVSIAPPNQLDPCIGTSLRKLYIITDANNAENTSTIRDNAIALKLGTRMKHFGVDETFI
jgi:hypothetical protein